MPRTLTVEDGTGVANANGLATLDAVRAYADVRGVTLTNDDDTLTSYIVNATDYLKTYTFLGTKVNAGQEYLPWPRSGLLLDDEEFPDDAIPTDIIGACAQLCIEQAAGVTLDPTRSGIAIKREKTGPIETEYVGSNRGTAPKMPKVDALLEGWIAHKRGKLRVGRG